MTKSELSSSKKYRGQRGVDKKERKKREYTKPRPKTKPVRIPLDKEPYIKQLRNRSVQFLKKILNYDKKNK